MEHVVSAPVINKLLDEGLDAALTDEEPPDKPKRSCGGWAQHVKHKHTISNLCLDRRETYESYTHKERLLVVVQAAALDFVAAFVDALLREESAKTCTALCKLKPGAGVKEKCVSKCEMGNAVLDNNTLDGSVYAQSILIAVVLSVFGGKFFVERVLRHGHKDWRGCCRALQRVAWVYALASILLAIVFMFLLFKNLKGRTLPVFQTTAVNMLFSFVLVEPLIIVATWWWNGKQEATAAVHAKSRAAASKLRGLNAFGGTSAKIAPEPVGEAAALEP